MSLMTPTVVVNNKAMLNRSTKAKSRVSRSFMSGNIICQDLMLQRLGRVSLAMIEAQPLFSLRMWACVLFRIFVRWCHIPFRVCRY